ncbi:MAG: (Fe-S)-binding protein [Nitrospirae bacterium]|nr:(Fe-S)-binding protein [Nitrospirota bacterium]
MNETTYNQELLKCNRCGACKALCPTYLTTLNETMGARGRIAMLGELEETRFAPTKKLAEKIFSCMLCGACKNLCPTGINIPEVIYQGRARLKNSFSRGRLVRTILKHSVSRLDTVFSILRGVQKYFYQPLYYSSLLPYIPEITPEPFKNSFQVYKQFKKLSRIAIFAGCSVNYFYPELGRALSKILLAKGFEVVVFKGELCCGAPLRSAGLEDEALSLAKKNIEHFSRVRAEAIISMCPTCTMVLREQYPHITGDTISTIMDINEFLIKYNITKDLEIKPTVITFHDPCHLHYGLGIKDEPRQILKGIKGVEFVEMQHSDECCGFAGFFSLHFKDISKNIGSKKIDNIACTMADTVVTSCPGCIMQLEGLKRETNMKLNIKHIVEVVDEAMRASVK